MTQDAIRCARSWTIAALSALLGALLLCAGLVYIVDPFEHYRAAAFYVPLYDNQLYCNSGIARHYDYDAVLLGSSMIENTKVSDLNAGFGVNAVKLPFKGGYPYNYARAMDIAFETHALSGVFYCMDVTSYTMPFDRPSNPLPEYLWNGAGLDDVSYLLNARVLVDEIGKTLRYNVSGKLPQRPRDAMFSWSEMTFSRESALASYDFNAHQFEMKAPDYFAERVLQNWQLHLEPYIASHPETTFYVYFPPYSVIYWVLQHDAGNLESQLWAREQLAQRLLAYTNVRLFDFAARTDWILDLNRYTDYSHHDPRMNAETALAMASGMCAVTDEGQIAQANQALRDATAAFVRPY